MKKTIIFIVAVVFALSCETKKKTQEMSSQNYQVNRTNFEYTVDVTGYIEPRKEVLIKSKASGEIIYFPYEEGDFIKKGNVILKLDPQDEKRNMSLSQSNYNYFTSAIAIAKLEYESDSADYYPKLALADEACSEALIRKETASKSFIRTQKLFAKNIVSEDEFEQSEMNYRISEINYNKSQRQLIIAKNQMLNIMKKIENVKLIQSNLDKASVQLDIAKQRLKETVIRSPMSGIVLEKFVESGQIISSGINAVSGGSNLLQIGDIRKYFVIADIDESDIGLIHKGQLCKLKFDAFRDKQYWGKISRIFPQGKQMAGITVYTVRIDITKGNIKFLKPDLSVNISVIIKRKSNVLTIPLKYIFEKKGKRFVFLKHKTGSERKSIKTGYTDGRIFIVDSGVEEGDIITLPNNHSKSEKSSSFVDIRRKRRGRKK